MSGKARRAALWPALLTIVIAVVVADFVHHPFVGSAPGEAAGPRPALTLWLARSEAAGYNAAVLRLAAGNLGAIGRLPAVGELGGGSAAAIERFAARRPKRGADLLAITSTTLADLARDRRDRLLPDARRRADRAGRLLRGLEPVGLLSFEPLRLAVRRGSSAGSLALFGSDRDLASTVFGIPADSWIEAQFAGLLAPTGVGGAIPFAYYANPENTLLALPAAEADVALLPSAAALAARRQGLVSILPWPGVAPPRAWVALFARAGIPAARLRSLRDKVAKLTAGHHWRALLARDGRQAPPALGPSSLDRFLAREARSAARLQGVAARLRSGR